MSFDILGFLTSAASGASANLVSAGLVAGIEKLLNSNPKLKQNLNNPSCPEEFQSALNELANKIEVLAGTGAISINKASLSALNSAQFNHQEGTILIENTEVQAPIIKSGGIGHGQTTIGYNTELRSAGTSIKTGYGASITITGNAQINQS